MAGIYIHIPFCKKKCNYCDFYSKRDLNGVDRLINCEMQELILRKDYLCGELVETIYFGGGTPSLLCINQIRDLLNIISENFEISLDCEITFECNPDDLNESYLTDLYSIGINRLSVGIQSFNNDVLLILGRRHDNSQIKYVIETAKRVGFINISIDLIFGIPAVKLSTYLSSLNQIVSLDIQHISAYSLTISEGTIFYKMLKNNKLNEVDDENLLRQFNSTMDILSEHGFYQYEISNYSKQGFESRHNLSYWKDIKYLGIGPSAHSYNLMSRQWNISDTIGYCKCIENSLPCFEIENLSISDKYNEYIIKGLRTLSGVSKVFIHKNFGRKYSDHFIKEVDTFLCDGDILSDDNNYILSRKGIFISDYIMRNLYFI